MKVFQEIVPELFSKDNNVKLGELTQAKPCTKCLIAGKSNMSINVMCQRCRI